MSKTRRLRKLRTNISMFFYALGSQTWRVFQALNLKTRDRWMIASRFWPQLIFQTKAERRVIGIPPFRHYVGLHRVFARQIILEERWFPIFRQTSRWAL